MPTPLTPFSRAVLARTTVRASLVRLVAGVLALLAGIAVFSLVSDLISRDKYRQAAITEVERSSVARQILVDLLNAQAGQRGFVITEDPLLLDRYQRGVGDYLVDLNRAQTLLGDDPELLASLARILKLADDWLAVGNSQVQDVLASRSQRAIDSVLSGPGDRYFDAFRAEHSRLIGLLDERRLDAVREARTWDLASLVAGVAAALLAAAIVGVAGLRVVGRVTGPLSALQAATRRIGRGDYGKAVPIHGRADELRDLASAFNTMQLDLAAARRQLEGRARELEEASRLKSEFVANVTHELRTPLAAIIGFSQLLLEPDEEPLSQRQQAEVQTILTAAEHLLGLIDDVLDLARIEGGHMAIAARVCDARDLVHQSTRAVASLATGKGLELTVDLPEAPVPAFCDPAKMRQVLINLLGNAVKFTDEGTIAVRARRVRDRCELSVTDTGPGIPAHQIDLVWEEFRQLDGSLTRRQGGTGLGLAITRRLVSLQGGTVTCESELGAGATFTVTLPARAPGADSRAVGVAGRVLVVQASARRAQQVAGWLRDAGREPLVVPGPQAVTTALEEEAPACVVLDLALPGPIRAGILRRLRERPEGEEPPLVLTMVDEQGRGLAVGVDALLADPPARPRLMEALARAEVELAVAGALIVHEPGDRRDRLVAWLEPLGPVRVAEGADAARAALRDSPALLLVDPLCSGGAGLSALAAARGAEANGAGPAVIVCFATHGAEQDRADAAGVDAAVSARPALVREISRQLDATATTASV